jgi:hypothetical protein
MPDRTGGSLTRMHTCAHISKRPLTCGCSCSPTFQRFALYSNELYKEGERLLRPWRSCDMRTYCTLASVAHVATRICSVWMRLTPGSTLYRCQVGRTHVGRKHAKGVRLQQSFPGEPEQRSRAGAEGVAKANQQAVYTAQMIHSGCARRPEERERKGPRDAAQAGVGGKNEVFSRWCQRQLRTSPRL